jgi:DNA ligase D-like protein (predicted 3'-phosphoesterase)
VIQHRDAGSDYYDLRLEIEGVLVSWALASTNPRDRRMARRTQDQPLETSEGHDGADPAAVWDRGSYANGTARRMSECLDRGHLSFWLQGERTCGAFTLTRIREGRDETWLLIRRKDEDAAVVARKPVPSQPEPPMYSDALDDLTNSP